MLRQLKKLRADPVTRGNNGAGDVKLRPSFQALTGPGLRAGLIPTLAYRFIDALTIAFLERMEKPEFFHNSGPS